MQNNNLDAIHKAVVYEPKFEVAQLYAKYLKLQNFEPYICGTHSSLIQLTESFLPEMLIYNIDQGYEPLKKVKYKSPAIIIITIGNDSTEQDLDLLMEMGISGHINRKVTQPRDIGILAKQLLQY